MDFLLNDLSLHEQFHESGMFRNAIAQVATIRQIAKRYGRSLYCNRQVLQAKISPHLSMLQAVLRLPKEEQRALMAWLTQHGPFWDDARNHGTDDWIEYNSDIVTDTAIGEAAWCNLNGIERRLVSFTSSNWLFTPVTANWTLSNDITRTVYIANHWEADSVEAFINTIPALPVSWEQLEEITKVRCTEIYFAADTFASLKGHPFSPSAAQRILFILDTLNRLKSCFIENGQLTEEGLEIQQNFFTGKKGDGGRGALFSDSSDTEKNHFEKKLTFKHPTIEGKTLFCTWHGKIQTPALRVHFSYPIRANEPLYVVYIGPKLTKH